MTPTIGFAPITAHVKSRKKRVYVTIYYHVEDNDVIIRTSRNCFSFLLYETTSFRTFPVLHELRSMFISSPIF